MSRKTVDAHGQSWPMPVALTSIALNQAAAGDVLEVIANDEGFGYDIAAWCQKTKNRLTELRVQDGAITATIVRS